MGRRKSPVASVPALAAAIQQAMDERNWKQVDVVNASDGELKASHLNRLLTDPPADIELGTLARLANAFATPERPMVYWLSVFMQAVLAMRPDLMRDRKARETALASAPWLAEANEILVRLPRDSRQSVLDFLAFQAASAGVQPESGDPVDQRPSASTE